MEVELVLDIVIPAAKDAAALSRCLAVLAMDGREIAIEVFVAANGEGKDQMQQVVAEADGLFPTSRLHFVDVEGAGKAAALNTVDGMRDLRHPVVYLDADCIIRPGTLSALRSAVDTDRAILCAPSMAVAMPNGYWARHYFTIWRNLPGVAGKVVGAGCYCVTPAGRQRWLHFPENLPDDAFVRSQFTANETLVTEQGGFYFEAPDNGELVSTLRRWRAGNRTVGLGSTPLWLSKRLVSCARADWSSLPAFILVSLVVRLLPNRFKGAWTPLRTQSATEFHARIPTVHVGIVTYNSVRHISACLGSIRCNWPSLGVTVLDNASIDGTASRLAMIDTGVALLHNLSNIGFAAAANQIAKTQPDADYLILVNPDARLDGDAIDNLIAAAFLRPDAGLYGGQMLGEKREIDPSSCLALPTLRGAALFCMGLGIKRRMPSFLRSDSLGGWRRVDTREVPVLTGGLLMISIPLWKRLGGFDEGYFLYGEDVDICRRARQFGARPLFTPYARYTHVRGGSQRSRTDMAISILRGKITYFVRSHKAVKAKVAGFLYLAGVGLRSAQPERSRPDLVCWRDVWRRRQEWRSGW